MEPSYAVKRRYGYQTEGRRPVRSAGLRPQLELWHGLAHSSLCAEARRVHAVIWCRSELVRLDEGEKIETDFFNKLRSSKEKKKKRGVSFKILYFKLKMRIFYYNISSQLR